MSEIAVRPVQGSDAMEVAALLNAIIARGGTTALETPYTPEHLAEAYLTGPEVVCCFVAFDRVTGRIEGFQTLGRTDHLPADWGDIGTFSRVDGTQRGVGTALFDATRARATELGLVGINATIRADNTGGMAFYDKMGFEDYTVKRAVPLKDGAPVDRIGKHYLLRRQDSTAGDRAMADISFDGAAG
jgi:RimJ/RimL family protein N-acetyltransferase